MPKLRKKVQDLFSLLGTGAGIPVNIGRNYKASIHPQTWWGVEAEGYYSDPVRFGLGVTVEGKSKYERTLKKGSKRY